jgi:hypothetical protein
MKWEAEAIVHLAMPTSFIVIEMLIIIVRSKVLFMFKIYVTKAMSFFLLNKTSCIFKDHDPAPFLSLSARSTSGPARHPFPSDWPAVEVALPTLSLNSGSLCLHPKLAATTTPPFRHWARLHACWSVTCGREALFFL